MTVFYWNVVAAAVAAATAGAAWFIGRRGGDHKQDVDVVWEELPTPDLSYWRLAHPVHVYGSWPSSPPGAVPEIVKLRLDLLDTIRPYLEDSRLPSDAASAERILLEDRKQTAQVFALLYEGYSPSTIAQITQLNEQHVHQLVDVLLLDLLVSGIASRAVGTEDPPARS